MKILYLYFRKKYRKYFWNKEWYKHFILHKLRKFLALSYLNNGWHRRNEPDEILVTLSRIEKKIKSK